MEINGKYAVVVGGALGMAKAAAERLVAGGAKVAIIDLPSSDGADVAKELEDRTQVISGFTNNPTEAARAHREKREPIWDDL